MADLERLVDACLMPGFGGEDLPDWVARALDAGMAGVALYGANLVDDDAIRRLSAQVHARRADALVAIDEEGGDVTRLDYRTGSRYPGNLALGVLDDVLTTEKLAFTMAGDLRRAGVDIDFAPSVDVNSDASNPVIGVRSFGSDPALVARHGAAFVRGLQQGGIVATAKHFPGHGATRTDSHHSLPVVGDPESTIRERDLPPFVAAIEAGALAVMTGHLLLPNLDAAPATLSRRLLSTLLREELGFDGVVVTDALDMAGVRERHGIAGAAVLALAAGADLLLLGAEDGERHRLDVQRAVSRAVREGDLPLARLEDAARRVRGLVAARQRVAAAATLDIDDGEDGRRSTSTAAAAGSTADSTGNGRSSSRAKYDRQHAHIGAEVAARTLVTRGDLVPIRSAVVVELRGSTNLAVGSARWSLADPMRDLGALADAVQVTPDGPSPGAVADAAGTTALVVAVRDAYRSDWQRAWVTDLLTRRPDATLVCLGMPDDARLGSGAVVLAHGAGRVNAAAAARRLVGGNN